jgi:FAD/FMN-containing dehydrogenase
VAELDRRRAPEEQILSRKIKDAIDPDGLMNPGKVLPRKSAHGH